ncbi:MAG: LysM domain-containing protein, partial [Caldilineae bacterium]
MGISLNPEPKSKGGRALVLLALIVAGAALLWGQRNRLAAPLDGVWLPRSQTPPILPTDTPSPPPPGGGVKLVYSAVVEADNPAFTADLYLEEAEHADAPGWAGTGGRTAVLTYTVQSGDTLWGIAAQFGL